jgi:hypothetical protein
MLYGQDRRELREVFFRAWRKHCNDETLEGVERIIVTVALHHPEYHRLLEGDARDVQLDALHQHGENPFLHMGLHIAIEEQLATDRPAGIRLRYAELCHALSDEHVAQHRIMECLGETLWQAGRAGTTPDAQAYLDCLARLTTPRRN